MQSSERARSQRVNKVLDVVGRTMIATGLLLLSFVAYQLWGTGIAESRAQDKLASQFRNTTTSVASTPTTTPAPVIPKVGDIVGKLTIPSIKVSKWIIAGVGYKQLEKGPGLFAGSPLPGQLGNVAIAGHRTTYGAPFSRIDEIQKGDIVTIDTSAGSFTYEVNGAPRIVNATDVAVVKTKDKTIASLTLVSCHPKWTSKQRIIVTAVLQPKIVPLPTTTFEDTIDNVEVLNEGWFHDLSALPQTIGLALLLVGIAIGASIIRRRGRSEWLVYPITAVIFVPVLFVFFGFITRLLPTNI
jgi:sortase A